MALKFSNTNDVYNNGIKALVYGISGAGKTTALATLPRPIILSAEKGLLSIAGTGIPVLEIETFEDLDEAYKWCVNPANQQHFDSIALDSITEIAEKVLVHAKTKVKDARLAYMELSDKMIDIIKKFRDIQGKHVIMTAKIESNKEELTGIVKYFPAMPGAKLTQKLPYLYDEVWFLGIKTDPTTNQSWRYIQTGPDFQVIAKDRSGKLGFMEPVHLGQLITKMLTPQQGVQPNG